MRKSFAKTSALSVDTENSDIGSAIMKFQSSPVAPSTYYLADCIALQICPPGASLAGFRTERRAGPRRDDFHQRQAEPRRDGVHLAQVV